MLNISSVGAGDAPHELGRGSSRPSGPSRKASGGCSGFSSNKLRCFRGISLGLAWDMCECMEGKQEKEGVFIFGIGDQKSCSAHKTSKYLIVFVFIFVFVFVYE